MRLIKPKAAGLAVHQKSGVAALTVLDGAGRSQPTKRTFGTMTSDL
jgi:hypothetical protein